MNGVWREKKIQAGLRLQVVGFEDLFPFSFIPFHVFDYAIVGSMARVTGLVEYRICVFGQRRGRPLYCPGAELSSSLLLALVLRAGKYILVIMPASYYSAHINGNKSAT